MSMDQQQQPAASNGLGSRELMRLPAQSRSVSRSRTRSPVSQHPDDDCDEKEFQRRVRAEESRVKFILAKTSLPALADKYAVPPGLPAFDDAKAFVGFYQLPDNGPVFCPPCSWPRYYGCALLDVDLAYLRYALDHEIEEKSPFVHSLSVYGSLNGLKEAALLHYFSFYIEPALGWNPGSQNPAHLIYLVPDDDLSALLKLLGKYTLGKVNGTIYLDTYLQLGKLVEAAGPETMEASQLIKLVDTNFATLTQRSQLRNGSILLDDGQHLPWEAVQACALLRVHAYAFQDVRICSNDRFASDRMIYCHNSIHSTDRFAFSHCGTNVRVVSDRRIIKIMIGMIKEAVFVGSGFRRHLYHHCSSSIHKFPSHLHPGS